MFKYISIQMSGRLGNQLFQWAFAHQLAIQYGKSVQPIYDSIHEHESYESHLSNLDITCTHIAGSRRRNLVGYILVVLDKINSISFRIGNQIASLLGILRSKEHDLVPILPIAPPKLVTGFYINWTVTKGIEKVLAFELQEAIRDIRLPQNIEGKYQVLHVRRGDFTKLKDTFGVLSSAYYASNVNNSLPVYICTDDEALVPEIALATNAIFVFGPNDLNPIQTLKFMSEATSLIMSNSTLSWWGGFLCIHNGGQAFLPKPYYRYLDAKSTNFEMPGFSIISSSFED